MDTLSLVNIIYKSRLKNLLDSSHSALNLSDECIVVGAGVSGRNFLKNHKNLNVKYIVDTREEKIGTYIEGIKVYTGQKILNENKEIPIYIVSIPPFTNQFEKYLLSLGFLNVFKPDVICSGSLGVKISIRKIKLFFSWLHKKNINYVYLRKLELQFDDMKDLDILVDTSHLTTLLSAPMLTPSDEEECILLDINWSRPIGLYGELPLFHPLLSERLMDKKNQILVEGIICLNDLFSLHLSAYSLAVHKGTLVNEEKKIWRLKYFSDKLGQKFDLSLPFLFNYLDNTGISPPIDFLRKWASSNNSQELIERVKFCQNKVQFVCFIFRDIFSKNKYLLEECLGIIKAAGFEQHNYKILNSQTRKLVENQIRGGVWVGSDETHLGGSPYAFGFFRGNHNEVRSLKERIRHYVKINLAVEVNCLHSSDDEFEAFDYAAVVGVQLSA